MGFNHYRYARRVDANKINLVSDGNNILGVSYSGTTAQIYNPNGTGTILSLRANAINGVPFITLTGNGNVLLKSNTNIELSNYLQGNHSTIGADATDVIFSTANNRNFSIVPNGTGLVKFGTHTAIGAETLSGYITIKDAGGTTRKLAVIS